MLFGGDPRLSLLVHLLMQATLGSIFGTRLGTSGASRNAGMRGYARGKTQGARGEEVLLGAGVCDVTYIVHGLEDRARRVESSLKMG